MECVQKKKKKKITLMDLDKLIYELTIENKVSHY